MLKFNIYKHVNLGSSASRPLRQQILTVQVENSTIDTSTTYLLAVYTLRSVPLCIRPPRCRLHDDGRCVRQCWEGVREKSGSDSAKLWRMKMPSFCQQGCEREILYIYIYIRCRTRSNAAPQAHLFIITADTFLRDVLPSFSRALYLVALSIHLLFHDFSRGLFPSFRSSR